LRATKATESLLSQHANEQSCIGRRHRQPDLAGPRIMVVSAPQHEVPFVANLYKTDWLTNSTVATFRPQVTRTEVQPHLYRRSEPATLRIE